MALSQLKLSNDITQILCCPTCHSKLEFQGESLRCLNINCNRIFPVNNGIPILIDETTSIFSINDILSNNEASPSNRRLRMIKSLILRFIPKISLNLITEKNHKKLAILLRNQEKPKVLIVGSGESGAILHSIIQDSSIEFIESDVYLGTRTCLVCDAHSIPFEDGSIDAVIAQAVLEHVIDPQQCADEIYRVLKDDGIVYSETPFMQQVHMGKYDFTRFTYLGHRRLFRKFEEIESGVAVGPATALLWSFQYFLLSFVKKLIVRNLITLIVRLTCSWLKYLDYYLANKPGAFDAASGYYFFGRKSKHILADKKLLDLYRGIQINF